MRRRHDHRTDILRPALALALSMLLACPAPLLAGGPMLVGGPAYGTSGQAIIWDSASPVSYTVDGGPLSSAPSGIEIVSNAAGIASVQAMFQVWEDVPTASIRFSNSGAIQTVPPDFTDGDVSTALEFNAVAGSCEAGAQSPILFDADGNVFAQLVGDPGVIGFAGPCKEDGATGRIVSGIAALNGRFRDTVNTGNNYELTPAEFEEAFVHEFGHFAGLDHSQINVSVLNGTPRACSLDDLAGLPLMFPISFCQARKSVSPPLPLLALDDTAWISELYPETRTGTGQTPFTTAYGFIEGTVFFSDGNSQAQGVNVIARRVSDNNAGNGSEPRRIAASAVSGYLFTGNPGQNLTGDNPGSLHGSRNPNLIGYFKIPVTPGSYKVEVESVFDAFAGGSSVGPLDPPFANPGANEFWDSGESATDSPTISTTITVAAGQTISNINIILNGTRPRFDAFESADLRAPEPPPAYFRRERLLKEQPVA